MAARGSIERLMLMNEFGDPLVVLNRVVLLSTLLCGWWLLRN